MLPLGLGVPRLCPARVAGNVEHEDRVSAVVGQPLGEVNAVALDGDVAHEVAPLVLKEVLAALHPVENEVARAGGKVARVRIAGAVELERDVRIDPNRKVIVEHLQREGVDRAFGALLHRLGFCTNENALNHRGLSKLDSLPNKRPHLTRQQLLFESGSWKITLFDSIQIPE